MLVGTGHGGEDRSPMLTSLLNHGLLRQYLSLLVTRFTHEFSLWNEGKNVAAGPQIGKIFHRQG